MATILPGVVIGKFPATIREIKPTLEGLESFWQYRQPRRRGKHRRDQARKDEVRDHRHHGNRNEHAEHRGRDESERQFQCESRLKEGRQSAEEPRPLRLKLP